MAMREAVIQIVHIHIVISNSVHAHVSGRAVNIFIRIVVFHYIFVFRFAIRCFIIDLKLSVSNMCAYWNPLFCISFKISAHHLIITL